MSDYSDPAVNDAEQEVLLRAIAWHVHHSFDPEEPRVAIAVLQMRARATEQLHKAVDALMAAVDAEDAQAKTLAEFPGGFIAHVGE